MPRRCIALSGRAATPPAWSTRDRNELHGAPHHQISGLAIGIDAAAEGRSTRVG
jgi:hypothetical protein